MSPLSGTRPGRSLPESPQRAINSARDLRARLIAAAGEWTQALGFGRNLGQIYGHVYLSPTPQSLDDLCEALKISKGSASMSVRHLEKWGALKRVWIRGARKDYFEAGLDFGRIARKALAEIVGRTDESVNDLLAESEAWLKAQRNSAEAQPELAFLAERVHRLKEFRKRARWIWNSAPIQLLLRK
jgi:DNA-binding transcriptional regulator GbsR (MarR family)